MAPCRARLQSWLLLGHQSQPLNTGHPTHNQLALGCTRPLHFRGIMATEDLDLARLAVRQLTQPSLVVKTRCTMSLHHELVQTHARRTPPLRQVHFVMMKIGVTGVQLPTLYRANGHAGMAFGMSSQGHQQDVFVLCTDHCSHGVEAEPGIALGQIELPVLHLAPLRSAEPPPVYPAARAFSLFPFRSHDVDPGLGKVLQASGMIEIKMVSRI